MDNMIAQMKKLLAETLPGCVIDIDTPARAGGSWWLDVKTGRKRFAVEYRPGKGFGIFHDTAGYGQGPSEIYRTPERASKRLAQLMGGRKGKVSSLGLKDIRELYGQSQVTLARKAGVKQPAISRFENRGEVKLGTLAATIKALGGTLEVRARFKDADIPIALSTSKR